MVTTSVVTTSVVFFDVPTMANRNEATMASSSLVVVVIQTTNHCKDDKYSTYPED